MKRVPLTLLFPLAALFTLAPAYAQDGGAEKTDTRPQRAQPKEKGFQDKVDDVFGDLIADVSYFPFYNIAGWMGLSTDAQKG